MRRVVVVGGGAAGLAAATRLAEAGAEVELLEAAPRLGGRARSFVDPTTHEAVDNGAHAVMGCYREWLAFLERIGRRGWLREHELRIPFVDSTGRMAALDCPALPAPLHFAAGLLRFAWLSPRERLGALGAGLRLVARFGARGKADDDTVSRILAELGQGPAARRALWDPLVVATLNADPARASARLLAAVVERALLASRAGSRFLLPAAPLSELYAEPARKYVEARGGEVRCSMPAVGLDVRDGRARGVVTRAGTRPADAIVLAVPPPALRRIAPRAFALAPALDAATPIVSVTLWLDRPLDAPDFVGLLDSETQWVFQAQRLHGAPAGAPARLACVRSGAAAWLGLPPHEIAGRVWQDVRRALPAARDAALRHALVVKEKRATLAPDPTLQPLRPGVATALRNVLLAGDWTATGLPATLESAAQSGHDAAERILSEVS